MYHGGSMHSWAKISCVFMRYLHRTAFMLDIKWLLVYVHNTRRFGVYTCGRWSKGMAYWCMIGPGEWSICTCITDRRIQNLYKRYLHTQQFKLLAKYIYCFLIDGSETSLVMILNNTQYNLCCSIPYTSRSMMGYLVFSFQFPFLHCVVKEEIDQNSIYFCLWMILQYLSSNQFYTPYTTTYYLSC